jgi:glycosyltransferase involved in cell wall biosynthesis
MITTFYPPYHTGGCGIHVYNLANLLAQNGHQVEIIHDLDSYFLKERQRKKGNFLNHDNIKIHRMKSKVGWISPLANYITGYPVFVAKEIKSILDEGFDLIHYHNTSLIGGPNILKFGNAMKFYTLYTYWLICPTHYLFKFNQRICEKKHCFVCSTIFAKKPPQIWRYTKLRDKMLENVDAIISPSLFLKQKLVEEGISGRIEWIPYFHMDVCQESYAPQDSELREEPGYFLFVGRLEFLKGVHVLIKAFNEKPKSKLLIAGEGKYSESLKVMARKNKKITFLGQVTREKLSSLYKNAIAVIIPSLWHENVSLVAIEALSHGTPIIVSDKGGLPETVELSGAGMVYHEIGELINEIDLMENSNSLRKKLSKNALASYEKYYSPRAHLRKYLKLVNEFL